MVPIVGDVDRNQRVNAVDIQLTINGALGEVVPAADFDWSGTVDAVDVQIVINAALGITVDTDGDGLSDAAEARLGTSPHMIDTDGDGIPDGYEMLIGLDPLDPTDAEGDLDGDGLSNLYEYLFGLDPTVFDPGIASRFQASISANTTAVLDTQTGRIALFVGTTTIQRHTFDFQRNK